MNDLTTSSDDGLNSRSHPTSYWSTTNAGEAMPGVLTPLGWSIWGPSSERGAREAFVAMGALERSRAGDPADERDRVLSAFHGRIAARVEFLTEMGDRLPGTDSGSIAMQLLGTVPPGFEARPSYRRYPIVAARLPVAFATVHRQMVAEHRRLGQWYPERIRSVAGLGLDEARASFVEAWHRFDVAVRLQAKGIFIGVQPIYEALLALIRKADATDLADALMSGGGSHTEMDIVVDLWDLARDRLDLPEFIARHGYHGPLEGEISGQVWREDTTPVLRRVEQYAELGAEGDPRLLARQHESRRVEAERELLGRLRPWERPAARVVLHLTRRNVPLRGIGKVAFLQALDVARASARRVGGHLADAGVLDTADDVFLLTADELVDPAPADVRSTVEQRRKRRLDFEQVELPTFWRGTPEPIRTPAAEPRPVDVLQGLGGSGGVVEGVVRVVPDPDLTDIEPGEIIVAATTDPSWSSVLFLCSALVVDIGGWLSHAAVVSRELGIPCVLNTRVGTTVLRTGDRCRVDGTNGTVELLEPAAAGW